MKLRPRLADHALARRYVRAGEEIVVIHDARDGSLCRLDPDSFALVACADGTRDVEGIALAASRAGIYTRLREITSILDELDALGLLDEGVEPGPMPSQSVDRVEAPAPEPIASHTLDLLPDYRFSCSGAGGCCKQYGSVALSALDRERAARAGLSRLPTDSRGERVFLPLYGAVRTERVAMTTVDGRCLQLQDDDRCGLEVKGGRGAKPVGCRAYPATLVDDGESVRVSVACECDCVFESRARGGGEPLVSGRVGADLEAHLTVRLLPAEIAVTQDALAPRSQVAAWSRDVAAQITPEAVPQRLVALAASLEKGTLASWPDVPPSPEASLMASLRALAEVMERAARSAESWRSPTDRTRVLRRLLADAAAGLLDSPEVRRRAWADESRAEDEALTVRATIFGHHVAGETDLAGGLAALAARLLVARALGRTAAGHPIAAVMAAMRGVTG